MFKFVTVLALVAAASAAPQTINYDLPGGQASITLGAPPAAPAAPAQLVKVVAAPRIAQAPTLRFAQAPQYVSFAQSPSYQIVAAPAPVQHVVVAAPAPKPAPEPEPFDANPQYSYSYNVNDAESGDAKSASETRDGDKVTGSYSVVEADGAVRTVTYTADAENGFNAKVERTPAAAPAVAVVAAPKPVQVVRRVVQAPAQQQVIYVQQPSALQSSNVVSVLPAGFNGGSFQVVPAGYNAGSLQGQRYVVLSQ